MKPARENLQLAYAKKLPEADIVNVVDFFCGCGGMSWGFANTRQSHIKFNVLAGIDIDENSLKTYAANISASAIAQDVREIAQKPLLLKKLVPELGLAKQQPLVFIGCAPCQGFSAHRKKDERDDPRNDLMVAFAKICVAYKPDVIVMENVPEILKGKYSGYFDEAAKLLTKAGFKLSAAILDLSQFGVPQRRKRAVIIGSRTKKIDLPLPILAPENAVTVRQAIGHLEPISAGEASPFDEAHKAPAHTAEIIRRIKNTPPDGGDRRSLSKKDQLACHKSIDKSSTPGFTDVYGRLRWDRPSVTITAKSSTPSCGRFLHPEQHRNISVREAAILQGFPQSFNFEGPFVHQYRQIGEAVPPLFSRFLAYTILNHFKDFDRTLTIDFTPASTKPELPVIVDCFAGAGGLSLGFQSAGFNTAFAFDKDADSMETYKYNLKHKCAVADVTDPNTVKLISQNVRDSPFILVGGPPCQGFSQQRRGESIDARNDLVIAYANLVSSLKRKPEGIVLENVTYLDSPRGKEILGRYIKTLGKLGYTVFRHDVNSADFGVAQLRRRIFVVALKKEIAKNYNSPVPVTGTRWLTIGEVLGGLNGFQPELSNLPNHEPSSEGELNRRRIAFVDMGLGRLCVPQNLQLPCHSSYTGHLDVFGRLDWFGQARTITGGFDSFTRGEYAHPVWNRSITPREAARIQGFPDWFEFKGNRASVRRQIGNAVPPALALALAKAIKQAILAVSTKAEVVHGPLAQHIYV